MRRNAEKNIQTKMRIARRNEENRSSFLFFTHYFYNSRDNSVGIALGCGLDDRGSGIRFLAGAGNFSLHHRIQNGSGAHPTFYPVGTRGSFPGCKAAEA
jgi:hypothetical protein